MTCSPMPMADIMKVARTAAYMYGRWKVDKSVTQEDYVQISALAIWRCAEANNRPMAFAIARNAIYSEYKKILAQKRQTNRGPRLGAPGDINDSILTSEEVRNALADRHQPWLNNLMVKDELANILIDESFIPDEARIIEALLRGLSPIDISNEYHLSVERVYRLLKETIKRIRDRLGIDPNGVMDINLSVFKDYSIEVTDNRTNIQKSSQFGGVDGRAEIESSKMSSEQMLKGGLDQPGLSIDLDVNSFIAKQEEAKKQKIEAARSKRLSLMKKFASEATTRRMAKQTPKIHPHRGGARKSMGNTLVPTRIGRGVLPS